MVLPTGSITFNDLNKEIGQANNTSINLDNSQVRILAGKTTAGSTISMSDLQGKGANVTGLGTLYVINGSGTGTSSITLQFTSAGGWSRTSTSGIASGTPTSGYWWGSANYTGIGSYYWIRFTVTSVNSQVGSGSYTASTGWLALTSTRSITVNVSGSSGNEWSATYTIEIASDSAGSYITTTKTGVILDALKP